MGEQGIMTHKEKEMELFKVLGVSINFVFPTRTFYIYIYVRTYCTYTQKAIKGIGRPAVQQ